MRGAGGDGHGTAEVAAESCVETVSDGAAADSETLPEDAGATLDEEEEAAAVASDSDPTVALFELFCPGQSSSDCLWSPSGPGGRSVEADMEEGSDAAAGRVSKGQRSEPLSG